MPETAQALRLLADVAEIPFSRMPDRGDDGAAGRAQRPTGSPCATPRSRPHRDAAVRLPWLYGGRLDKTGATPRQVRRRGWRQTRMAGVYTDQRLNLSKLGKAFGRKPRFQTGPGKSGRPGL